MQGAEEELRRQESELEQARAHAAQEEELMRRELLRMTALAEQVCRVSESLAYVKVWYCMHILTPYTPAHALRAIVYDRPCRVDV